MKRRQVKERFLSLDTIEAWSVYVPIKGWMGKTKYLSAFERSIIVGARHRCIVGARHRCQVWVRNCNTDGFFHAQQFPVCIKNGPPPKGHPANITTVGRIGVNMSQHPCGMLSTPCRVHVWRIEAVLRATPWGGKSILGRRSFFFRSLPNLSKLVVIVWSNRCNSRTDSGEAKVESRASSETQPNQASLLLDTMPT